MKALCAVSLALLVGGAVAGNTMPNHLFESLYTFPKRQVNKFDDYLGDKIREATYEVTFESRVPGIAMLDGLLPVQEMPTWEWVALVLNKTATITLSYLDPKDALLVLAAFPDINEDTKHMALEQAMGKLRESVDSAEGMLTTKNAFELNWKIIAAMKALQHKILSGEAPPPRSIIGDLVVTTIVKLFDVVLSQFIVPDTARPGQYEGYPNLFDPLLKHYEEPQSNREIGVDEAFGRYRVAGYVPFQLRKVEPKLLKEMSLRQYRGKGKDLVRRVEKALSEGRLYGTDYAYFAALPRQAGKFYATPVALFEIPEDEEVGKRVGVQALCVQITKGVATSIFTPSDSEWAWKYAKVVFNGMEGVFHEGIGHLAHTHLVVEAILLSLKRVMAPKHPLRQLVDPHLEGTALINWLAENSLLTEDGAVAKLLPTKIAETREYVASQVLERLDQNLTWPAFMEAAGMTEEQFPAKYYPYRDYAGRLWTAYHRWVGRYLRLVYPDDTALNGDRDIEQFRRELIANKVGWVEKTWAENEGTVALLTDVITSLIFIGSAQHAAVNFAQGSIMVPAGCTPLSLYTPPANYSDFVKYEQDVIHSLPPIRQSLLQRDVLVLLSTHYTDMLHGYEDPQFDTKEMVRAAKDFHDDLADIERYQNKQNKEAVRRWKSVPKQEGLEPQNWAYTLLLPSRIPMSINI